MTAARYPTPESLQAAIDLAFANMDAKEEPYSKPALADELGLCQVEQLNEIGSQSETHSRLIKKAVLKIERQLLGSCRKTNGAGSIFLAKAAFGYWDRPQQGAELDGISVSLNISLADNGKGNGNKVGKLETLRLSSTSIDDDA